MLPPWREMKLEMPETRPFWSGQVTNSVAVSDMGAFLRGLQLVQTEGCRASPGWASGDTRPCVGRAGPFLACLLLFLFSFDPGSHLLFEHGQRQGAVQQDGVVEFANVKVRSQLSFCLLPQLFYFKLTDF